MNFKFIKTENLYAILDFLPKIPENLYSNRELSTLTSNFASHYIFPAKFNYTKKDGKTSSTPGYNWTYDKTDIDEWICKNICDTSNSLIYKELVYDSQSNFYKPHVDKTRKFVMIYNIDGGEGNLVFWERRNKNISVDTVEFPDYPELDEVCRVYIPDKTWYILNASKIHSVENLIGTRKSFQFTCELSNQFVKTHLIPF